MYLKSEFIINLDKYIIKKIVKIYILSFILFFIRYMWQIHTEYEKLQNGEYGYISDIVSEKYNNWNPMCILFNYIQSGLLLALIVSIIYLYISTIVTLYRKDDSSRVSACG